MKNIWKRVCTGILALTTILTALPITSVQAAETQYCTESSERVIKLYLSMHNKY